MKNRYSPAFLMALVPLLASCGDNSERYLLPDIAVEQRVTTSARTVEVGRLDLPAYVQDSEIALQSEDGVLRGVRNGFWADDPDRAMTETLAAGLDQAISADVVAEPSPLSNLTDVRVDVKVRRFVGLPGQTMLLSGQYFLSSPDGGSLQVVKRFDFSVPIASDSVEDYALAQSQALKLLSVDIANSLSRVSRSQL